ncbi:MAG: PspC domain-containing protein [Proteobacteria bacterium]|nr:PspC domain-containing protein [Pseudomonadota bacterium]
MKNRLYRSRYDRMIGGVCGGLGQYLGIDPTLIRLGFLLLALAGGSGMLIYFLMLIVVPENIDEAPPDETGHDRALVVLEPGEDDDKQRKNSTLVGGFLVIVGIILLFQNFGASLFNWFDVGDLWPFILIIAGGALLWRYYREEH